MDRVPLEICEVSVIHEDVLARVKEKMPDEEPVYEVSELFKVFGCSKSSGTAPGPGSSAR